MEDECARGESAHYSLWFDSKQTDYAGCLFEWSLVSRVVLFFESNEIKDRFKRLIPDDDYIFMQEWGIDREPRRVLFAKFLTMYPPRLHEYRIGFPKINFHESVDDMFDAL